MWLSNRPDKRRLVWCVDVYLRTPGILKTRSTKVECTMAPSGKMMLVVENVSDGES